jgi:dual specificity MAP kinase phosphatase
MATIVARAPAITSRTSTPPPHLTLNTSARGTPTAIPNKHIPVCSPGPRPTTGLNTPPASPPQKHDIIEPSSLLRSPSNFKKLVESPPVFSISASSFADAIEHLATQPLPDPKLVFPWLHGLHPENQIQLAFFLARRKSGRKIPHCLRGITVVKAGGNLAISKLKGSISPEEILSTCVDSDISPSFIEIDPRDGFSVRNFQIQACKIATVSDIVVYGDDITPREYVMNLAKKISQAQRSWQEKQIVEGDEPLDFHTFVLSGKARTSLSQLLPLMVQQTLSKL